MARHDFFIAGRWRNHTEIKKVLDEVRGSDKSAYCFIENEYEGWKIQFKQDETIGDIMKDMESLDQNDDFIKHVFNVDLKAQLECDNFLLVLPAGISGHIEAGISYGAGKKCYAIGKPGKTETLYSIFDIIFPDIESLRKWLKEN